MLYVTRSLGIVLVAVVCGVLSMAHAQQTIFNVPSTDVLDKGKVYVELDASLKPTDGALVPKFSVRATRSRRCRQSDRDRTKRYRQHSTGTIQLR